MVRDSAVNMDGNSLFHNNSAKNSGGEDTLGSIYTLYTQGILGIATYTAMFVFCFAAAV